MNNELFRFSDYDDFIEPQVRVSLKKASEDKNSPQQYMTLCTKRVIDMDEVKKSYLVKRNMHEGNARSVDALYLLSSGKLCMVEFKNGGFHPNEIIEKALSSVLMFNEITNTNIGFTRKNMVFVLVYNEDAKKPEARQIYAKARSHRQREKLSFFGLDNLNQFCFSDVEEIEKCEFDNSKYVKDLVLT